MHACSAGQLQLALVKCDKHFFEYATWWVCSGVSQVLSWSGVPDIATVSKPKGRTLCMGQGCTMCVFQTMTLKRLHVGAMRIQIVYKHRIWSQTDKTIPFFPDSICDMYS